MLPESEKTPSVVTVIGEASGRVTPTSLPTSSSTPGPIRRTPPPGRPSGAMSTTELVERITKKVTERAHAELTLAHAELRATLLQGQAEIEAEVKMATRFGIAALTTNGIVAIAILGFAHMLPSRVLGLALAGFAVFFGGVVVAGLQRGRRHLPRRRPVTSAELPGASQQAAA